MDNNQRNKDKINELLPSMKFIYASEVKSINNSNIKMSEYFDKIKLHLNKKINTDCLKQILTLENLGILQILSDEEKNRDEYKDSLYQFKLLQKDKYQNDIDSFTDCVTESTSDINKMVDYYTDKGTSLSKGFTNCNTFMMNKYDFYNKTDEEAMEFYQKCLQSYSKAYNKLSEDYLIEIKKYI
jgi:hypothetical protein